MMASGCLSRQHVGEVAVSATLSINARYVSLSLSLLPIAPYSQLDLPISSYQRPGCGRNQERKIQNPPHTSRATRFTFKLFASETIHELNKSNSTNSTATFNSRGDNTSTCERRDIHIMARRNLETDQQLTKLFEYF